jgi:transposase
LVPRHRGLLECARRFWGAQTGPNPTDRRKSGTKHHVITDGQGIPLAVTITGANRHDVTQLIPLVDAIPPIRGKRGRPRRKPNIVIGDRGYDSNPHRAKLLERDIRSLIARRNTEHGSGLGILRWYVERTIGWLHKNRRLSVRYEKRADIHQAFLTLGCIMVCFHFVEHFC